MGKFKDINEDDLPYKYVQTFFNGFLVIRKGKTTMEFIKAEQFWLES